MPHSESVRPLASLQVSSQASPQASTQAVSWLRQLSRFLRLMLWQAASLRLSQTASSLTFTWLLAMVPLLTVVLAVATQFSVYADLDAGLKTFLLRHFLPDTMGTLMTRYIDQFVNKAGKLSVLGLFFLLVTATAVMHTLDKTIALIWGVRRRRSLGLRVLTYWLILLLGPLAVGAGSLLLNLVVDSTALMTVVITTLVYALAYRYLAGLPVHPADALLGGFLAAALTELAQMAFSAFFTGLPTYRQVYGALAAIPSLLIWTYLNWLLFLLGALLTSLLPSWSRCGASMWRQEMRRMPRTRTPALHRPARYARLRRLPHEG